MKEHAKASTVVNKSYVRTPKPSEKIRVEPSVAMVKDLLVDNIDRVGENDTYVIPGNPFYGWRGVELRKEQVYRSARGDFYPGSGRK